MNKIYFATSNRHKFREAEEVVKHSGMDIRHFPFEYREIRSDDIAEIAADAVTTAYERARGPVFVEDTGLFITALNGFPGTYSAWALRKIGVDGILALLKNKKDRAAEFKTCIAYHDGTEPKTFFGVCKGHIAQRPRGDSGFGYDPIFIPEGKTQTFAEGIELKKALSHRYKALTALISHIKYYPHRG